MKLTKQKQQHLVLVGMLTLMVCGGVWFGLIRAQNRRLAETALKAEQARNKQADIRKLVGMRERIATELEAGAQQLTAIEATFAEGLDLYSWFLVKVPEFQQTYGVALPQISKELVSEMSLLPDFPYRQATYSIRGNAYFEEMGRFVSDFENRFPYFRLLNLEVEQDDAASTDGEKLGFRLEVATLIKPAPAPMD